MDPLEVSSADALAMTHRPEQPNPAQPYLAAAQQYFRGGVPEILRAHGIELPSWLAVIDRVLNNPDNQAAMGMALPLKGVPITAYHGSPHDFDRFDLSRIGTGEGAQAYGHGLYFAENLETAKNYRDKFDRPLQFREGLTPEAEAKYGPEIERLGQEYQAELDRTKPGYHNPRANELYEAWAGLQRKARNEFPRSKLYQVSINADPEHFLDWDKPLSEQSGHVQSALSKAGLLKDSPEIEQLRSAIATVEKQADSPTQQLRLDQLRKSLTDAMAEQTHRLQRKLGEREAANQLRQAGIPGIKYLDQGSRAGGEGTRNYVVFDDKLIDILKKYGLAGAIGGGAAATVQNDPLSR